MITERDPRVEPKAGDVLTAQEKKSKKMVTRIVNKVENGVVYFSPQKPINLSCFIPKWKKWAAKATVVKAAPCLILAALLLTGCDRWNSEIQDELIGMRVVQRDGCEYLANRTGHGGYVFTHKGDCKNHKYRPVMIGRNGDSLEDTNPNSIGVQSGGTVITTIPPIYITEPPSKTKFTPIPLRKDLTNLFIKAWTLGNNYGNWNK